MTFNGDAGFEGITLSRRLSFGSARPAQRLRLAVGSSTGGIGPTVDLEGASFAGPAVVTANPGGAVQLVSLAQTDTTNLTLAGLDLCDCLFLGAINLERLRIDGPLRLRGAPGWWRARRRVLREEGALRGWSYWNTPGQDRPDDPTLLQAVYRELRKGREDAKDEPGAADFYYGEMEMRRLAATGWERALLTLYWLVSGYALRATRSLFAFAVVVAVFAVLLYWWGFQPASAPDLGGAFVYSVESATVFFRGPGPEQLTEWGRVLQVCLRLLGPALLALTVLAVRGRVKR